MPLQPHAPIHTAHLVAPLHRELMTLLRGLSPDDWLRPTVAGDWRVRDVAAHLLVVDWINHLNATGVETSRRLSTRVLTDLLDLTGLWVAESVMV